MKKHSVIITAPLILGLLTGCNDDGKQQFDTAAAAALQAEDPFQALTTFEQNAGDYGKGCGLSLTDIGLKACELRKGVEAQIIMASVDKGSEPALVFLFTTGNKSPKVYPYDVDEQKILQAAGRFIDLAEKATTDKGNQRLLMSAADVLQSGKYVLQDSRKAISLYIRAWQAGNQQAAKELVSVYRYLKDYQHAYFWEIRSRDFSLDSRAQLTNVEINDIQRMAADIQRPNL